MNLAKFSRQASQDSGAAVRASQNEYLHEAR